MVLGPCSSSTLSLAPDLSRFSLLTLLQVYLLPSYVLGFHERTLTIHCLKKYPSPRLAFQNLHRVNIAMRLSSYYGGSESSFMIQEFSTYDALENIVRLSAKPLPERPDGIVTVAKYTSVSLRDTEAEYERLARAHPSTIFLRAFAEYKDADILFAMAQINTLPTFDIFYGGNRVGRVEGVAGDDLEKYIVNYGFINSKLDLFSEEADNQRQSMAWGDGRVGKNANKTPRTTGRFVPGYDWDKSKGFFDDLGERMIQDFENTYGNWLPPIGDDDVKK
jgi:hypothetical protein